MILAVLPSSMLTSTNSSGTLDEVVVVIGVSKSSLIYLLRDEVNIGRLLYVLILDCFCPSSVTTVYCLTTLLVLLLVVLPFCNNCSCACFLTRPSLSLSAVFAI